MDRDGLSSFASTVQRLIYRLVREYELCDRRCLTQHGVTASQGYALLAVPEQSSASMNELSQAMGLANSTMTRMVDHLVRKGLAYRRPDGEDRRVVRVGLTTRGGEVRRTLEKAKQDLLREVLSEIREDERSTILYSLDKLAALMGKALRTWGCCGD